MDASRDHLANLVGRNGCPPSSDNYVGVVIGNLQCPAHGQIDNTHSTKTVNLFGQSWLREPQSTSSLNSTVLLLSPNLAIVVHVFWVSSGLEVPFATKNTGLANREKYIYVISVN